jgi:hypothetical protein
MKIIEKLKELEARATEGPFVYKDFAIHSLSPKAPRILNGDPIDIMEDGEEVDWELFAISRNALPALLKIVKGVEKLEISFYHYYGTAGGEQLYKCKGCGKMMDPSYSHKENCPVALIEQGLKELEEAGE